MTDNQFKRHLLKVRQRENLSQEEIGEVMRLIMSGNAASSDVGEFLMALRAKGPTVEEITGAAKIMRQFVLKVNTKHRTVLDTCGTGGDRKGTFNISTVVALVVAGAGVAVAKHGNRSVSSKCGSADILEALGVNLNVEENFLSECLDEIGIAFLFAQRLHPAMKNVAAVRRELKVETIFNILGPLTNPANATHQMVGVYNRDLVEPVAQVLRNLGLKRALVVHGSDGLDEITTTGLSFISEYNGKEIISYDICPEELGFTKAVANDLDGGDLAHNVKVVEGLLRGEKGPRRDIVLLNAAFALYTVGKVERIEQGVAFAAQSIDSGSALQKLEDLKKFTNKHRQ